MLIRFLSLLLAAPMALAAGDAVDAPSSPQEFAQRMVAERLIAEGFGGAVLALGRSGASATEWNPASARIHPIRGRWPRAQLPVTVEWQSPDDQTQHTQLVWLSLQIPQQAWVFTRHAAPGTAVSTDLLELRQINRAELSGEPWQGQLDQQPLVLSRAVRRGQVALQGQLAEPPAVSRESSIVLVATHNDIDIRLRGRSLQDGQVGEAVLVRTDVSATPVKAIVIAAGQARLDAWQ